jgi:hypothetical protein
MDDARLALLLMAYRSSTSAAAIIDADLTQTWLVYAHRLGRGCDDADAVRVMDALLPLLSSMEAWEGATSTAVACGLHSAAERLLRPSNWQLPSVSPHLFHVAAYNLDTIMLRLLLDIKTKWVGVRSLRQRTAHTERTPLCCAFAQLARLIVGPHHHHGGCTTNAVVLIMSDDEKNTQFVLDDTAEEAHALVETLRSLRSESPSPVMLPIGIKAADGIEAARLMLVADAASSEKMDSNGRCAVHYWAACVSLARRLHQPSAFISSLLALIPLFPPGATLRLPSPLLLLCDAPPPPLAPAANNNTGEEGEEERRTRSTKKRREA